MILGFAHITKNVDSFPVDEDIRVVTNAPAKWPLMERQAKLHSLFVLANESPPQEFVKYDTGLVPRPGRLRIRSSLVIVYAQDTFEEAQFFCDGLSFKTCGRGAIELTSQVPQWGVVIKIQHDPEAPIDPPLDIKGYAALAFYSTNVEADRDMARAVGGCAATEPFTVKLDDREMKIIMLRSPEGTIIELIEVKP